MVRPLPTRDEVIATLKYDPLTGIFTRVTSWGAARAGNRCVFVSKGDGYIRISVRGRQHLAHRLAWLVCYGQWPECQIDHANGDRADNRLDNLRICSISENRWNSRIRRRNTSGVKGVTWDASRKLWMAQIMAHRKKHHLGRFEKIEDAAQAYRNAAIKFHGEFARFE